MSAANVAAQGLSEEDLQRVREALAAGRKPKVVFTASAGQIAGQIGQVIELTDPAVSDEYVVVRFGRDELPFSPADVAIAPKGAGKRPEPPAEPQPQASAEPKFMLDRPSVPRQQPKPEAIEPEAAKPARKPGKPAAKQKAPAGLTVTLAYTDGEWTVAAQQGSKVLAKPYLLKPAEALKITSLVDVPGVQEAVEQILSVERAEAEQQAQKLRAELAEIEARLAELREAG